MPEDRISDDSLPRAFHAKLSRRAGGRAIGAGRKRRHTGQRLALLAAAIALPSMAAPADWPFSSAVAEPLTVTPMAFETPGESFPGSAFYYLADTPYVPESTAAPAPEAARYAGPDTIEAGPVAHALMAAGTPLDRMRAQRCLAMAIYYEAATESDAGQRAVAQVVLNRVAHPAYPNSVCGVVFQGSERSTGCQFTFTCDGSLARAPIRKWWDRASKVARAALAGAVYEPVGLATHYHTLAVHPYWASSLQRVGVIGSHLFYRWRGAAGLAGAFDAHYAGGEPLPAPHPHVTLASATPDAADPLSLARAYERGLAEAARPSATITPTAVPVASSAGYTASASPAPAADVMPQSGGVKAEYAHSGQWLRQP